MINSQLLRDWVKRKHKWDYFQKDSRNSLIFGMKPSQPLVIRQRQLAYKFRTKKRILLTAVSLGKPMTLCKGEKVKTHFCTITLPGFEGFRAHLHLATATCLRCDSRIAAISLQIFSVTLSVVFACDCFAISLLTCPK